MSAIRSAASRQARYISSKVSSAPRRSSALPPRAITTYPGASTAQLPAPSPARDRCRRVRRSAARPIDPAPSAAVRQRSPPAIAHRSSGSSSWLERHVGFSTWIGRWSRSPVSSTVRPRPCGRRRSGAPACDRACADLDRRATTSRSSSSRSSMPSSCTRSNGRAARSSRRRSSLARGTSQSAGCTT